MARTPLNLARMSVSGTPGTGDISLGSALTSFISFATAGATNGMELTINIVDGNAQAVETCVYSTTGPALTTRSNVKSTTGSLLSLTSAAIVSVVPSAADLTPATTAQYLANTSGLLLSTDQINASGAYLGLTDGANIAWDMALGFNASFTIGGNRTLDNPTNPIVGRAGIIKVTQSTGSHTLAYGTNWEAEGGSFPVLSTAAGAKDIISYFVDTSTSIIITGIRKAMA
jgi:hypothetical protein